MKRSRGGKINILVLNWRDIKNPTAGGAEVVTENVVEGLRRHNTITFFTSYFPGAKKSEKQHNLKIIRRGSIFTVYIHAFLYVLRHRRDFDAVIESVSTVPFFIPLIFNRTSIIIPHHLMGRLVFNELPFYKAIFAYAAEKLIPVLYKNSYFIAVSKRVADEFYMNRIPKDHVFITNPGISFRYEKLYKYKKAEKFGVPTIITVSRLMRYKRVDMLIKLFSEVRKRVKARLIVVGTGNEEQALKALASRLGIRNDVVFKGYVTERRKVALLKKSWVFATASSMEGFGLSILEAEKCALPVVAFDIGGISDAVKDNYSGFLVKDGDCAAYIEKLLILLSRSRIRHAISKKAALYGSRFEAFGIPSAIASIISNAQRPK